MNRHGINEKTTIARAESIIKIIKVVFTMLSDGCQYEFIKITI